VKDLIFSLRNDCDLETPLLAERRLDRSRPRSVCFTLTVALLISSGAVVSAAEPVKTKPVKTQDGMIQGTVEDGLAVYRGVPYAAPPVGQLRWRRPQPVARWQSVRQADKYGPACVQANTIPGLGTISEDCLYLNVWTPATKAGNRLAVLVWIHGGGFYAGGTAEPLYHGEGLAQMGVVLVSLDYRLGVLGFLAHPDLSAEDKEHVSGNYGLLDMIAALNWVQKNIAAFGGDPKRVTISGESAGAIAVSMLCASPLAKGRFQGAISESGGSFGPVRSGGGPGENVQPLAEAEKTGVAFASKLGVTGIDDLRSLSVDKLLDGSRGIRGLSWPVMDGWVIPDDQYKLYKARKFNNTPILVGYNSDEGALFSPPRTIDAYVQSVRERYGPFADRLLALYPAAGDGVVGKPPRDLTRDTAFGWSTWTWARLQSETGKSKAFLYYFDQEPNFPPDSPMAGKGYAAVHGSELPYVFGHFGLPHREQATPSDLTLSRTMMTYWTNFAKTGNPNGAGLPNWPAYNDGNPKVMHFRSGVATAGPVVSEGGLKELDSYFERRRTTAAKAQSDTAQ
jgi:para-nitrobenzyl esterase